MQTHPSSALALHVAGLSAALRAEADHHAVQAGLVMALHALILAAPARIMARLENLIALWQAGQLPAPQPRTRTAHTRTPPKPPETPLNPYAAASTAGTRNPERAARKQPRPARDPPAIKNPSWQSSRVASYLLRYRLYNQSIQ